MVREVWKENNPPSFGRTPAHDGGDCCGDECGDEGCRIYIPCCVRNMDWSFTLKSDSAGLRTVLSKCIVKNNCNNAISVDYSNHNRFTNTTLITHRITSRFDDFFGVSDPMNAHRHFFCSCNGGENFEVTIRVCNVGVPGHDGARNITLDEHALRFECGSSSGPASTTVSFPFVRAILGSGWTYNAGPNDYNYNGLAAGTESTDLTLIYSPADYNDCPSPICTENGDSIEIPGSPIDCYKKVECIGIDQETPSNSYTEKACDHSSCPECECVDGVGLCTCQCLDPEPVGLTALPFHNYKGPYKLPIPFSGQLAQSDFKACFAANALPKGFSIGYGFRKPKSGDYSGTPWIVESLIGSTTGVTDTYTATVEGYTATGLAAPIVAALSRPVANGLANTCTDHDIEVSYDRVTGVTLTVDGETVVQSPTPGWVDRFIPDASYYGIEPLHAETGTPPRGVVPVTVYV